jgi:hypothetical protein
MAKWRFSSHRWVMNHYSWRMCTTSIECKTVITVVLIVMSGMDPDMITGTWDLVWLSLGFGLSKWVSLGYGSVTVRLRDAIEVVILETC